MKEEKGKGAATDDAASSAPTKKVKFAEDTKPPASGASTPLGSSGTVTPTVTPQVKKDAEESAPKVSGVVGQIEVYESGAVKLRLGNGILLDVRDSSTFLFTYH